MNKAVVVGLGLAVVIGSLAKATVAADGAETVSSPLPRSTPEAEGVSSAALYYFATEAEREIDALNSFMLVRHGNVVAEGWWFPYGPEVPHQLYSLSKSFTGTAVGLAEAEAKFTLDDPVLGFFPNRAPPAPSDHLRAMRVRDLLRMSSGQTADDIAAFRWDDDDLVKEFLAIPVPYQPGTHFAYNTEATYVLSAIVQKVTGLTVRDYLQSRLFGPLGMGIPRWDESAEGICLGGFGLSLRTEDLAKFGLLYLRRGVWSGRQILPPDWVGAASSFQASTAAWAQATYRPATKATFQPWTKEGETPRSMSAKGPIADWSQGYGYQFWRCRHGFYRGDGAYGQWCIVMPQYDAVVAITGGVTDMQAVMDLVWDDIVPGFNDKPLPPDASSDQGLSKKLTGLRLRPSGLFPAGPVLPLPARRYTFQSNPDGIESLALEPGLDREEAILAIRVGGIDQRIPIGRSTWRRSVLTGFDPVNLSRSNPDWTLHDTNPLAPKRTLLRIAAIGGWAADGTFAFELCRYETPFRATYHLHFAGDRLDFRRTLAFVRGPKAENSLLIVGYASLSQPNAARY